jgi:hypothetical protein
MDEELKDWSNSMDNGHIFIKNYIKSIEDSLLEHNPDIGKMLIQDSKTVKDLITLLYQIKDWQDFAKRKYDVMVKYIRETRQIGR